MDQSRLTSLQHPLVKHFVKLRTQRKYRYESQSVTVEGKTIIREICQKIPLKTLLYEDRCEDLAEQIPAKNKIVVSEAIINKISGVKTSEGMIAEIAMPKDQPLGNKNYLLALDRISDPGNMGTLIRTALAFGWEGVYILDNSCDPFNDKTIRASRGAVFCIDMIRGSWQDLKTLIRENDLQCYAGDAGGDPLSSLTITPPLLLVMSHESQGISDSTKQLCQTVAIPMKGEMESLNVAVAGGILLFNLRL